MLGNEHFLFHRRVVAEAGDAQGARREAVECAAKVARICVEPVCGDGGAWAGANLAGEEGAGEGLAWEETSNEGQEHGDIGLRDGWIRLPAVVYVCIAVRVEEVVIGVR